MEFDDFKKLVNENPERLEKVIKRNNEDSKAKIQRTVDHLDDYDSFALVTIRGEKLTLLSAVIRLNLWLLVKLLKMMQKK